MSLRRLFFLQYALFALDAAAYLGTSPPTIRRLTQYEGLPAYQPGPKGHIRVRFTDIDEFMGRYGIDRVDTDKIVDEVLVSLKEKGKK